MDIRNITQATEWFEVLQTTSQSQTAVMTLQPGQNSEEKMNVHQKSDQVLIVISGEVFAKVADETGTMRQGDVMIIPAGTPHQFINQAKVPVVTFNVYTPPEY